MNTKQETYFVVDVLVLIAVVLMALGVISPKITGFAIVLITLPVFAPLLERFWRRILGRNSKLRP